MRKKMVAGMAGVLLVAALGAAGCGTQEESSVFSPRLDTEADVVLGTVGFFSNFEAFDQVTNDFNQFYPNVEFVYEQVSSENLDSYLDANKDVDIIMTSEECFDRYGDSLVDYCADLSKEDINLNDIEKDMLSMGYHDGKLSCIPMGQNIYGLIVNKTLLENEGLSVPANYEEFLNALAVLKDKGYTPIQGPTSKVYAELTQSMAYDMILNDETLYEDLMAGKESAADALTPVFEKVQTLMDDGYIDPEVNATYPEDNYDQAILTFFEGKVPFWVCNTEKVSGMKKRESKSEAFQANPFEYTYIYAPLGDKGAYAFQEPWFGFAVNADSTDYDYAVEFIRFLTTKDEINKIADVKGVPSVAAEKSDIAIYKDILNTEKTEMKAVNEGKITPAMVSDWYGCMNGFASGSYASAKEAAEDFVARCSGSAQQ